MARSAAGSAQTHRLGVRLLGEFGLDGVDLSQLKSRQARTVLKRLALAEGGAVSADALAETVWGSTRHSDPLRDLYVLLSRARAVVGADHLLRHDAGYLLRADSWDRVDLVALTHDAGRRQAAGDLVGARTAAEAAVALARGPLLADGPEEDWVLTERTATARVIAEARRMAAEAALALGRIGDAAEHARAALRLDPYDEVAVRIVLRALAATGRPASALAEYAVIRRRLRDDLGVEPSPATRALHEQILRGDEVEVPRTGRTPQLVGRETALRSLDEALQLVPSGGAAVLVTGEPGIGKTALLESWGARARGRGVVVLTARAEPGCLSLQPLIDALATRLGSVTELDAAVAGVPVPSASREALTRQVIARLDGALDELSATARHGLALVLDDAHEADDLTWRWLAHTLRRPADHRFLVVLAAPSATALPTTPTADLFTAAAVRRIELGPLDRESAVLLVDADRLDDLLRRSGGNALLLTELARAAPAEEIPTTVQETVTVRLRRCGPAVPTLQAAAVLEPAVDLDLLAGVLDAHPLALLDHLDVGIQAFFLVEQAGALTFRHELVRSAISADAGPARQVWLHRRAAALLWQRPDSSPIRVAAHARAGGDSWLAVQALARAADLAADRLDLAAAEQLLDEALGIDDRADLHLRRGRIRMARGDVDGADADADAAMGADTTGAALELRTWAARNRHDLARAIRLGTAAAAAATTPAIKASSLIALAFAYRGSGDLGAADRTLAEAVGTETSADLGLSSWVGVLRVHQGRPTEALAHLEPMLGRDAIRGRQAFWVEHTLQMTAHAYGLVGRPVDALRVLDKLAVELERRGTVNRYGGAVHTYRSWLLRNLGAADEAAELAAAGLQVAATAEIRGQCHLDVSDCLLRAGRLDDAERHLDQAQLEAERRWFHNRWRFDQRLGILRARLALASGDPASAREQALGVVTAATRAGDRRYQVLGRLMAVAADGRRQPGLSDLALLGEVAALEGWWFAADVAEATGSAAARHAAVELATRLIAASGDRTDQVRQAVTARLG